MYSLAPPYYRDTQKFQNNLFDLFENSLKKTQLNSVVPMIYIDPSDTGRDTHTASYEPVANIWANVEKIDMLIIQYCRIVRSVEKDDS